MEKVSTGDVREIFDTDIDDLQPFVDAAHLDVKDLPLDDDRKAEIERWAAAHYAAARDKEVDSKSIEGDKEVYAGERGEGYKSTDYGQRALQLDTSGQLGEQDGDAWIKHAG